MFEKRSVDLKVEWVSDWFVRDHRAATSPWSTNLTALTATKVHTPQVGQRNVTCVLLGKFPKRPAAPTAPTAKVRPVGLDPAQAK